MVEEPGHLDYFTGILAGRRDSPVERNRRSEAGGPGLRCRNTSWQGGLFGGTER